MTIHFHSAVLISEQVENMVNFYKEVLQQEVAHDFGACVIFSCGLSIWRPGDNHAVSIHMQGAPAGASRLELCFETDRFDDTMESLRKHPLAFLHSVQTESWGQYTARFFDPDRNLIEIGESIPCFVRRMVSEGKSFDEVAAKTSVPIDTVRRICEESQSQ